MLSSNSLTSLEPWPRFAFRPRERPSERRAATEPRFKRDRAVLLLVVGLWPPPRHRHATGMTRRPAQRPTARPAAFGPPPGGGVEAELSAAMSLRAVGSRGLRSGSPDELSAIHGFTLPFDKNQSRIQIRLVFFILVS